MRTSTPLVVILLMLGGCASPVSPVGIGVYHLDGVDATNLELAEDGTFRWGIYGCDFAGGDAGRWHVDGDAVVLTPADESDHLEWNHSGSFRQPVTRIELREGETPDVLWVRGFEDGAEFEQEWAIGGRCVSCEGGVLGPTGSHACEDPYLGESLHPGG